MELKEIHKDKSRIFLVGFMGCGKSTLAKKLARKMGYTFIDLDAEIVSVIGMSIADYFSKFGEASFRAIEKDILKQQEEKSDVIIATGGGTPCHFTNMAWMNKNGLTVYLKLSSRALFSRLSQKSQIESRPLLKGKTDQELMEFISTKLEEREYFYSQSTIIFEPMKSSNAELIKGIHLLQEA